MPLRVVAAPILRSPALRTVELAFLLFNAVEYGTWVAILLFAYAAIGPTSVGLVAVVQLVPAALVAPLVGEPGRTAIAATGSCSAAIVIGGRLRLDIGRDGRRHPGRSWCSPRPPGLPPL